MVFVDKKSDSSKIRNFLNSLFKPLYVVAFVLNTFFVVIDTMEIGDLNKREFALEESVDELWRMLSHE